MKAVQLSRFGGPEVLEIVETPTPSLRSGEVLVRVHAAGINFFEVLMRQDRYAVTPELPMTLGV
jgi:NADPH2:quinone reductase